ncbi:hypothetical protein C1646_750023 [Rhizophagus diaphanus]|nr:hypothetical protein C1646_750023 [Rhizophagus diaphanus] [Rhizophagus sp. MUCL 43196]
MSICETARQDLKKCHSINDIWKDEVIREIRRRFIVNCTFTHTKRIWVKISCSKKLWHWHNKCWQESDEEGWIDRKEVSVTLPNIFNEIVSPSYLGIDTANFVVVDKPEYDLVLGNNWLVRLGYRIDKCDARYWEDNEEKRLYYIRNN